MRRRAVHSMGTPLNSPLVLTCDVRNWTVATPAWSSTDAAVTRVVLDSCPLRSTTSMAYSSKPAQNQGPASNPS